MSVRTRILVAIVAVAVVGYVAYRLFAHSSHLLTPAVLTPEMDAHRALSPAIGARIDRLLNDHIDYSRADRPRLIALTFDDGPYPIFTPLLLDQLHDLQVPATFFLIGRDAEQYPELTKRIEAGGNEVADHTYSHPDLDQESAAQVRDEILKGRDVLREFVQDPGASELMRPPHGRYTEETIRVAQQLGYKVILWTDDGGDWRSVTPTGLATHLEDHATAPEIVLLHSGKLATIQMLPRVVARFRKAGYQFLTMSQLLARVPVGEINHPARHPV